MAKASFLGEIYISDDALVELAGIAALECYGVVGMVSPDLKSGVAQLLSRDRLKKGIKILHKDNEVKFDLYVVAEYGTNLSEVARNLSSQVKYTVEKFAGVKVSDVGVHIQEIRIEKGKEKI